MKKIVLFTLTVSLISSCLPQGVQVPQSPYLSTLERKAGLIAYIGVDGNIYVADQGGGNSAQLTDDAVTSADQSGALNFYQLPTWSQDGNQLAFVGTNGTNTNATAKLFVANINEGKTDEIYSSETEHPFYLYWSPDGANVSFLSTSVTQQTLILQSAPAAGGGERTIIDTGSPYYWSWAPDGRTLITHVGGGANASAPEHIAFIQLKDSEIIEDGLDTVPASFQAPAWSPDGSHIVLTRLNNDKKELILTDGSGTYQKTLGSFDLNTAFGWSNDNKKVAFIEGTQDIGGRIFGDLKVVDIETTEEITAGENVFAFFWSPNGEKLAYFEPRFIPDEADPTNQTLFLKLNMYDGKTGESRELFNYQPTEQFTNILLYFDQYQKSNTIWSPDNNNMVLSFLDPDGNPGIAIVAASGQLEPRFLAQGYLAFWSWK